MYLYNLGINDYHSMIVLIAHIKFYAFPVKAKITYILASVMFCCKKKEFIIYDNSSININSIHCQCILS